MKRMRELVPAGTLFRARFLSVVASVLGLAVLVPAVLTADLSVGRRITGVVAMVLLIGTVVTTYVRRRLVPLDPVVVPVLMVIIGANLADSMAAMGLGYGVLFGVNLYGSHRAAALRTVGLMAAVPVAIAIHPMSFGRLMSWYNPAVLVNVPQLAFTVAMMRILYVALVAQERARAREGLLARTGSRLLGINDVAEVHRLAGIASRELCGLAPGTVVVVLARDGDGVTVLNWAGMAAGSLSRLIPDRVLLGLDPADADTIRPVTGGLDVLRELAPGVSHWRAVGLAGATGERFLLVGGGSAVPDEDFDALRTLGHQVTMAEASCVSRDTLYHQAYHDHLTGLPTRALFLAKVAEAVESGAQDVTLLNIDLDNFKQVNDVYGHGSGDELLVAVAARLIESAGSGGVAARLGGDEFIVMLTGVSDLAEADRFAERMCQRLLQPMHLSAATVTVGASIGVATWAPPLTAGDLMRCADIAMYSAKARGKNRVERFTAERHGDIARHRLIEEHLATAIDRDEIVLHYQPYVDVLTGHCLGVEALVRWEHPTLGRLLPDEFMPVVERLGLSTSVGTHVLRTACCRLAELRTHPGGSGLRLGVNIATAQLRDPVFADTVRDVLADARVPADLLTLELVDSEQSGDPVALAQLRAVADTGTRIAIDSPSAGQPSLDALWAFPVHQLKMGASALRDPGVTAGGAGAMTQLMTALSQILRLEIVIKHVETMDELELLCAAGVNRAQGHLFGYPMPARELDDWLSQRVLGGDEKSVVLVR